MGKFFASFFFTCILFSLLSIVIDFSEKVEAFINSGVSAYDVITQYYLHFIPWINGMLWPLFVLISVVFFTSRLARNSEIISMLNAGMSYRRILVPYMAAALAIATIHFVGKHFLIPLGNNIRIPFENEHVQNNKMETKTRHIHMMLDPDTKLYIRNYRYYDSTAYDMRVERYDGPQLLSYMEARRAEWLPKEKMWRLQDYTMRSLDGMKESLIIGTGQTIDTTLNLSPKNLIRVKNQKEMMTSPRLNDYIREQHQRGLGGTNQFETEYHKRTSEPFSILILTIIGVSVASRKVRGGVGLHLAIGIGLGALFILLSRFSETYSNSEEISPLLGVWIPNIIFGIIAIYLTTRAQR